jgi:hypothetical protein
MPNDCMSRPFGEDGAVSPTHRRRARHDGLASSFHLLSMVIVCRAVIVSGRFAGVLTDRWEHYFWGGSITALAVFTSTIAAAPVGSSSPPGTSARVPGPIRSTAIMP